MFPNRIALAPVNAVVLICQWKCQEGLILTTGQRGKEIAVIRCNRGGRNAAAREGGCKERKGESQVRTGFLPGMNPV